MLRYNTARGERGGREGGRERRKLEIEKRGREERTHRILNLEEMDINIKKSAFIK